MALDPLVIGKRLKLMAQYLETLKDFEEIALEQYLADFKQQLIVERLLELMIQAAIDINKYLLVNTRGINPETNQELFIEAGKTGILDQDFAREIAPSAGLRNVLAHQYETIDSKQVFLGMTKALQLYPLYIQQIVRYIDALEGEYD